VRALPAGPFGVLLEFDDGSETRRCYEAIERMRRGAGATIVDVVPAERTVLMISTFDAVGQKALRDVIDRLRALPAAGGVGGGDGGGDGGGGGGSGGGGGASGAQEPVEPHAPAVELPVRYDGPDLDEVATLTGLSTAEVVRLHTDTEFTVAFTGFAPGFAYLAGLPEELTVPRRTVPRTKVAAGAVGLAGPYSGVYPRASPGGWQIIGHLAPHAETLWDVQREAPALLRPGMRVRFRRDVGTGS
jgi:KipI family sensor histidine kinase inhibitor